MYNTFQVMCLEFYIRNVERQKTAYRFWIQNVKVNIPVAVWLQFINERIT